MGHRATPDGPSATESAATAPPPFRFSPIAGRGAASRSSLGRALARIIVRGARDRVGTPQVASQAVRRLEPFELLDERELRHAPPLGELVPLPTHVPAAFVPSAHSKVLFERLEALDVLKVLRTASAALHRNQIGEPDERRFEPGSHLLALRASVGRLEIERHLDE